MDDDNNLYGNSGQPENGSPFQYGQQGSAPLNGPGSQGYGGQPDYGQDTVLLSEEGSQGYGSQPGYGQQGTNAYDGGKAQGFGQESPYGAPPGGDIPPGGYPPPGGSMNGNYGQPPSQGFGIASLVCGIIALVTCCVWCICIPLGVVAIVFGILQLQKKTAKGMAIAGIVCAAIGVVLAILLLIFTIASYENDPSYNRLWYELIQELEDY